MKNFLKIVSVYVHSVHITTKVVSSNPAYGDVSATKKLMQNVIKLENISNLITSPSSYQCRKTRLVHLLFMADTHQWNVCVRTGDPQR
jgi:hypothetical protein